MRVGVFVAYWPWFSPEEQVELAQLADELGLDSVWVAEAWGQDAVSVLGYLAAKTERIALGSALMQIPARPPAATAMAAASLDVLSGGRFRLGLGPSGPQVSEGWYGVPFTAPLGRTKEYVEIVRRALARETLAFEGKHYQLPTADGTGLGKPLRLLAHPIQERIPIYLGSIGPKSLEQTGAIADGWLPFMLDPSNPEPLLEPLRRGVEAAGRSMDEIDVSPCVPVAVHEDVDTARDLARPWIAFYLGSMGAKSKNFYVELLERSGHGEAARAVQERALARDNAGAMAAVTPELIDATSLCCRPQDLEERLARYEAAGADTLLAVPCGDDKPAVIRALAAASVGEAVG